MLASTPFLKRLTTGIAVPSKLATGNPGTAPLLLIVLALLTIIFWGNVFRFSPGLIDRTYDTTSDGMVIGRLARAAADGFTSEDSSYSRIRSNILSIQSWSTAFIWSGGPMQASSACMAWFFRRST
jgi:hypothetical protein